MCRTRALSRSATRDRDQEVRERQATLRGGRPVESGHGDGHRDSAAGGSRERCPTRRSLAAAVTRTGRPARWTAGWRSVPDRPPPASRPRRRGRARPRRSATGPSPTSSRPPASATISAPTTSPSAIPRTAPARPEDAGLDDDRAPDLATGHPGRTQDADLADPFDDVHRQRVDDPERGDDDRDDRQRVEQPEDAAERVVDGALDLVEGDDLEGERVGLAAERVAGRRPARPARSGPRTRRHRRRRDGRWRRSSRRASPRRPCPGIVRSTIPTTRRSRALPSSVGTVTTSPRSSPNRSARACRDDRRRHRRRGRRAPRRGRRR